jgi:hypothetical protein
VKDAIFAGVFNVHSRAAVVPVPEVKDRENEVVAPAAAVADDTARVDVVAPKQLEK